MFMFPPSFWYPCLYAGRRKATSTFLMNNLEGWNSHIETAKAAELERLYQKSGRTNGLYTGLHKKHNRWYRRLFRFLKAKKTSTF